MTIFDILGSILFNKQKSCFKTVDEEGVFSPFIVNRWISMYSPQLAILSNKINKYIGIFENKSDLYTLFYNVFPKVKQKRIQYFKKNKVEKKEDDLVPTIARNLELSQREIREYMAFSRKGLN